MKYNTIEYAGRTFEVFEDGRVYRKSFVDTSNQRRPVNLLKFMDNGHGYMTAGFTVNYKRVSIYQHRAVALAFLGEPREGQEVDHIDGNPKNNSLENIRWVSKKENNRSRKRKSTGKTSPYRGVSWNTRKRKWAAQVSCRGGHSWGGYFDDEKNAAAAYNKIAKARGFHQSALNDI